MRCKKILTGSSKNLETKSMNNVNNLSRILKPYKRIKISRESNKTSNKKLIKRDKE